MESKVGSSKVESKKKITFSEGYAKIVEIFRDADLNLPDYSKSLYANAQDKNMGSAVKRFFPDDAAKMQARLDSVRTKLTQFKNELSSYEQTDDVKALVAFSDILIKTVDVAKKYVKGVESGEIDKFGKTINMMKDFNQFCRNSDLQKLSGFDIMLSIINGLGEIGKDCNLFLQNYPKQAQQANVTAEFVESTAKLVSFGYAFNEMKPLLGEICDIMLELEKLQSTSVLSNPDKICADPDKAEEELDALIALLDRFDAVFRKISNIMDKYPDVQTDEFNKDKITDTLEGFRKYRDLLASMKGNIETMCSFQNTTK